MDRRQKAYAIFAVLVLLWLGSKQRGLESRSQPSTKQSWSVSQLNKKASTLLPGWGATERTSAQVRQELSRKTSQLLLASSSIKAVLDSKARQQALQAVQPFDAQLRQIENASASFFAPVGGAHGVAGAAVAGSSVRGRSSPSRSSSGSSYSHK